MTNEEYLAKAADYIDEVGWFGGPNTESVPGCNPVCLMLALCDCVPIDQTAVYTAVAQELGMPVEEVIWPRLHRFVQWNNTVAQSKAEVTAVLRNAKRWL